MPNIKNNFFTVFKKTLSSVSKLLKAHKFLCLILIALVLAVIVLAVVIPNIKASNIEKQLNGKLFVAEYVDSHENTGYRFSCFKSGKYSYERFEVRDNQKSSYGNIYDFDNGEVQVKAHFLKNNIQIYTQEKGKHKIIRCTGTYNLLTNTLTIIDPSEKCEFREITLDDYKKIHSLFFCRHENAVETILTPASCTEDGKKRVVCNFCQYEGEEVIPKGHKYDHHICEVCGKRGKSLITPNKWKTDYSVDLLNYYNCEVEMPVIAGAGVQVICYPVCQKCHYVSMMPLVRNIPYGMESTSLYTCSDCHEVTIVKLACHE